jgi:hypothetical protein
MRHTKHRAWLDTATNQPEAMAFYEGIGYAEVAREGRPEWHWTLVTPTVGQRSGDGGSRT